MNIAYLGERIRITLSKRNLEQLLAALEQGIPAQLDRMTAKGHLVVVADSDEHHYNTDERIAEVGDNIPGAGLGPWL